MARKNLPPDILKLFQETGRKGGKLRGKEGGKAAAESMTPGGAHRAREESRGWQRKGKGEEGGQEARGGEVMSGIVTCSRSKFVHANCDRCGERPEVMHRPRDERDARYCENCCPACSQQPAESVERASSYDAASNSVRRDGRE